MCERLVYVCVCVWNTMCDKKNQLTVYSRPLATIFVLQLLIRGAIVELAVHDHQFDSLQLPISCVIRSI